MTMSPYIRTLRARYRGLLEVPTVAVLTRDEHNRVLLVRHVDGDVWTTPGGMIEPLETPADAAVREMWEETGLWVSLDRIVGVFGGPEYRSRYANGDEIAWVSTVFEGHVLEGDLTPDGQEISEAAYFSREDARKLKCQEHVLGFIDALFAEAAPAAFEPPRWCPPR